MYRIQDHLIRVSEISGVGPQGNDPSKFGFTISMKNGKQYTLYFKSQDETNAELGRLQGISIEMPND